MLTSLALAALTSLLVQFLLVALVSTLRPAANVYVSIIIVSVVTAPFAYAADAAQVGGALGRDGRVFMALIHMALGGFLFHFMTLPDRSVTLRILVELLLAPGQVLSTDALRERYGIDAMITSRLRQLSSARFIDMSGDGHINLTGKGITFGRFITAGRALFGIASAN